MSDSSNRQNSGGYHRTSPNERNSSNSRRDVRTCSVCENSKKNFTYKEFEIHCVSVAHVINEARMKGDNSEFSCGICKFKCFSKEEMLNHINAQTHDENLETYQCGNKNKGGDNQFFKKRKVQEGTDSGMLVPTKCHGYYGTGETMSDFSKTSKDGGIHVTRSLRNEVLNKKDDETSQISAPRCTIINNRNLPGIRDNAQTQKKAETSSDSLNFTRSFPKQAVPRKSSRSQASSDKDNATPNNSSSNLNSNEPKQNVKEVPSTDLEQSTTNTLLPLKFTNYVQTDKNSNVFTELSNNTREINVDEEFFNNKYKNSTTEDLISSMGQVYSDLGAKKNELFEVQKIIKKYDEEFRYLYKKISENYQKNI
uniref:C2H2-type domain-containing protein n=1 Tax=Strongyloides venezuelensis TaxID=75913 RepID=A0A0K0F6B1_STRVS